MTDDAFNGHGPFTPITVRADTTTAPAEIRMCVACGATRPASEGRDAPGKDCPAPDACTWDMTEREAADHWRRRAHDLRIALALLVDRDVAYDGPCVVINAGSHGEAIAMVRQAREAIGKNALT